MPEQLTLFDVPAKSRRPPRVLIVERERCNVHGEVETRCSANAAGPWGDGDYWVRDMTVDRPHGRVVGVRDTLAAAIGMVDNVCWREYQIRNRDGEIVRGWWRAAVPAVPAVQRGGAGG